VTITNALSYHNFSELQTKRETWRQKTKHSYTTQLDTTFCLPWDAIYDSLDILNDKFKEKKRNQIKLH
jgi:hypothetical protein